MIPCPSSFPLQFQFSSKECCKNTVTKLSLRFVFCQGKVLGKLFSSQDK